MIGAAESGNRRKPGLYLKQSVHKKFRNGYEPARRAVMDLK